MADDNRAIEYRVLDLSNESGVYCGKLLADMGADVIKVEPREGCSVRKMAPFFQGKPGVENSLYFMSMNTSKRGVTLDLETSVGKEVFIELVKTADVVLETFPVGYLASLGLGYQDLKRINPKIVMTSITPFGQTGPFRNFKGSDMIGWAMGGAMTSWGLGDRAPLNIPGIAYTYCSLNASGATMAALLARRRLGVGQHVDISIQESIFAMNSESGLPKYLDDMIIVSRTGSFRKTTVPAGFYKTKDGSACVVFGTIKQWDDFAQWHYEVTGDEMVLDEIYKGSVQQRAVYVEAVNYLVEEMSSLFSKQDFYEQAVKRSITISPVNGVDDVCRDPQLEARGYWQHVNHPVTGTLRYPGAPYIFSESPWKLGGPAPLLGQHNEEILVGELGLSRDILEAVKPVAQS